MKKQMMTNLDYPDAFGAKQLRARGPLLALLLATTVIAALAFPSLANAGETSAADDAGFSISVDGEQVAGNKTIASEQSGSDVTLENVDIQIKFDGLDTKPRLNVSTTDLRRTYQGGEALHFIASSNYPAWISRSELRIFDQSKAAGAKPIAIVAVGTNGQATWNMPDEGDGNYIYVLRVYDHKNRFDETKPLTLSRSDAITTGHASSSDVIAAGVGEDRTATRNIPVFGGSVTVYGRNVPSDFRVKAIGKNIPVDGQNSFVTQQILPPGDHEVAVSVSGGQGEGIAFKRQINIPSNEWFYVALADLTLGQKTGNGKMIAADPSQFDKVYSKGRLAFYLKGKIKGKYLLTAAADTGEDKLQNLFSGLDSKDPRQVLRRIDPNAYYPVYGDDSTSVNDAPTRGKFYVRLERGDSHVMWGNFSTKINGGELLRNERVLYGASGVYKSEQATSFGERKVEANAYAAQPDTLPQRDVLRGTGGSAYFLKRQDVVLGSQSVSIEVRDLSTGRLLNRRLLKSGADYNFDPLQGVIILTHPLASSVASTDVVRDPSLADNAAYLVVQYEYTPTAGNIDGYSYGGRTQAWLGEHLRVGATAMNEQTGAADQRLLGADVLLRHSEKTYLSGAVARSQGPGFGRTYSADGGLTIAEELTAGQSNKTAMGYSLSGQVDLGDISNLPINGELSAHYAKKQVGFSTLDEDITKDQTVWGVGARFEQTEKSDLHMQYDEFRDSSGKVERKAAADLSYELTDTWKASLGVKYAGIETPGGLPAVNGSHTDGAAQLTYSPNDDTSLYAFGQATIARTGGVARNDRVGLGGKVKLTEKIGANAEVSSGTSGFGALAGLTYDPTADDHYYAGYRLDPSTGSALSDDDLGGIVFGAKNKYNDELSSYAENKYDMFGQRLSLTSTYGVVYTPDALWTTNAGLEFGRVMDKTGDFNRKALSAAIAYHDQDYVSAKLRGEARFEDSTDGLKDRQTYLGAASLSWKTNDDWRFIANLDAVISNSDQSSLLDGDYIEGSLGYAYRPVANDRFNALIKYSYLHDLPGPDQVTANGSVLGPSQRSHIFSFDASYDLNDYLTLGGKYGFRSGEVSTTRAGTDLLTSSAHLAIVRADIHVVKNWDALLEGRILSSPSAKTTDFGALAAVYRHLGDNVKVGVGYNFGRFSDDLRDLTFDDMGLFLNVVGTF